jgi:putative redox protein
MGLCSCSAVDVVHILKKARQLVTDCEVEIDAERAEVAPKVFTRIRMHFVVSGSDLSEKQVRRAVDLSAEKYCSASVMLKSSVTISHSYEIRKPAEETTAKL